MLVAVISDTHDDLAITRTAVEVSIEREAHVLIHCGDLACRQIVTTCSRLPFYFTFGNHDADAVPELIAATKDHGATCLEWGGMIELANKQIGVTNSHMKMDLQPLIDQELDYLLTGHTHETADTRVGSTRRICPGTLFRADPLTFALLDLATDQVEFVYMSN